ILYEICRDENPSTKFISESKELKASWFVNSIEKVGISGATSTPTWLLKEVVEKIKSFTEN
ncbi:MAG: 4-hydroxy-3-methylbut-2-enyl diphosphate reductase, partial [Bacteroidota bacterium]